MGTLYRIPLTCNQLVTHVCTRTLLNGGNMTRLSIALQAEVMRRGSTVEMQMALKAIKTKIAKRAADKFVKELLDDKNSDLWFIRSDVNAEVFTVSLECSVEV